MATKKGNGASAPRKAKSSTAKKTAKKVAVKKTAPATKKTVAKKVVKPAPKKATKRPLYQSPIDPSIQWDGNTRVTPDFIKQAVEDDSIDAWLAPGKKHHVNVERSLTRLKQRNALMEWGTCLYEEPENFNRLKAAYDGFKSNEFDLGVMYEVPFHEIERTSPKAQGRKLIDGNISGIHYLCKHYEGNPFPILLKLMEWSKGSPFWFGEHKYSYAAVSHILQAGRAEDAGRLDVLKRIIGSAGFLEHFGQWAFDGESSHSKKEQRQHSLDYALEVAVEPLQKFIEPTVRFLLEQGASPHVMFSATSDKNHAFVKMVENPELAHFIDIEAGRKGVAELYRRTRLPKDTLHDRWATAVYDIHFLAMHAPYLFDLSDEFYVCLAVGAYEHHIEVGRGVVEELHQRLERNKEKVHSWNPMFLDVPLIRALEGQAPVAFIQQLLDLGCNPFGGKKGVKGERKGLAINSVYPWHREFEAVSTLMLDAMVAQMKTKELKGYKPLAERFHELFEKAWMKKTLPQAQQSSRIKKPIRL